MRVKRYVVDSMPEALQRIRTELGKDAVILNTKEIRSGGFLGMFGKKKIEVIAAIDASGAAAAPAAVKQAAAGGGGLAGIPSAGGPLHGTASGSGTGIAPIAGVRPMPQSSLAGVYAKDPQQSFEAAIAQAASAIATAHDEPLLPPTVSQSVKPAIAVAPAPSAAPVVSVAQSSAASKAKPREELLLEEIKQMKDMMAKLSKKLNDEPAYPEPLLKYKSRLLEHEFEEDLAERIIRLAAEEFTAESSPGTEQFALEMVRRQLKDLLTPPAGEKSLQSDTRIAHFVGPTGVGKTTTIAKLAAEQVLKYNRKVGFITSDTYRIAAVEQLKTYATILNVPLEVVFSPQELVRAFTQLKDCELIFMDTAGRNFRNPMYVSELNSLLHAKGKSETFLVLSLSSKYKDMKAITDNFAKFRLDKVLFTKMDETRTYGSIFNLLYDFPLRLSYITNGQNVPDDIQEADEDQLINRILEEPTE
ncbi:flagellar biosynthesis protein FlhF [Paenibacillus koleovorans]|uniref:flagellar biosynthesis protein FlhF n=1 Tax=Paenibacillus koleovorans TaxID=121608 RepID=UPI000FD81CE0|nr:flagellar biosynthesis protein FlhF [Paenibacillus koleovorans]